jgi:hypothetical protein
LDVNGNVKAGSGDWTGYYLNANSAVASWRITDANSYGQTIGFIGTDTNHSFAVLSNGGIRAWFDKGGNVGIGTTDPGGYKLYVNGSAYFAGGYSQPSDIRFKKNIMPIGSPLTKVLGLEGVAFDWNTEEYRDKGFPDGRHYGIVAQDLEKILPELVREGPDGEKIVAYTEIIPVLIEAIKEQQQEIVHLRKALEEVSARVK